MPDIMLSKQIVSELLHSDPAEASISSETVSVERQVVEPEIHDKGLLFYISDIHLDEKIKKAFLNKRPSPDTIRKYVEDIAASLGRQTRQRGARLDEADNAINYIVVAGDVSRYLSIWTIFMNSLVSNAGFAAAKYIAVLGNHELSDAEGVGDGSVDSIVSKFKENGKQIHVNVLHNDCFIAQIKEEERHSNSKNHHKEAYVDYLTISIKELAQDSSEWSSRQNRVKTLIFGCTGFAGLNSEWNADNRLYGMTLSREEEIRLSEECRAGYALLSRIFGARRAIIVSHNPTSDWIAEELNPNFIHISGHTHRNVFEWSDERKIVADNQYGYSEFPSIMKSIPCYDDFDYLNDLADGITEITREQYAGFGISKNLRCQSHRKDIKILCLKNSGCYMFLGQKENGALYVLNGGQVQLANHDAKWYFEHMPEYVRTVREVFKKYRDVITELANEVVLFGGRGHVHGCIVDIDRFNHLYLNPWSGEVIPYFSLNGMTYTTYPTVEALLSEQRPELSSRFIAGDFRICYNTQGESKTMALKFEAPNLFKDSNKMLLFESTFRENVIREWDDNMIFPSRSALSQGD